MAYSQRAFTLIELLIVVAIIAILAAIAVPNFLEAQVRSKVSRGKNDMRSIANALESYRVDCNQYPMDIIFYNFPPNASWPGSGGGEARHTVTKLNLLTTPVAYMTSIPRNVFANKGNRGVFYGMAIVPARPVAVGHCGLDNGYGKSNGNKGSLHEGPGMQRNRQRGYDDDRRQGEYEPHCLAGANAAHDMPGKGVGFLCRTVEAMHGCHGIRQLCYQKQDRDYDIEPSVWDSMHRWRGQFLPSIIEGTIF